MVAVSFFNWFAEREGFEPPVPLSTPVFKTGVIDHSTISPNLVARALPLKSDAKVRTFSDTRKLSSKKL